METGERICNKIDRKRSILSLLLLLLILMVGFVGYCGWEISHNSKLDSLIYIIYLTAMVTLGLIVLLTLFFLIIEFFIKLEYQVGEIKKLVQATTLLNQSEMSAETVVCVPIDWTCLIYKYAIECVIVHFSTQSFQRQTRSSRGEP